MALSNELLMNIFEYNLNENTQWHHPFSFGLTNSRMYRILKHYFKSSIFDKGRGHSTFYTGSKRVKLCCAFHLAIGEFLGPAYRPRHYDQDLYAYWDLNIAFLRRPVYDHTYGKKELEMRDRWADHLRTGAVLLRPYNMGDDWYAAAIAYIREERLEW